ncbi:hypothetical protein J7I80_04995 [Bacillus sp. ISL-41]|uniref:hypothetical protein n=1 Tax=Bacillus sp. ISL-41 TaxID=2819127 RepID=UPI001BE9872B|nr:hypothetical protein [Bacillus sp. ISL-41]MBT2641572.1 hypothetical protein [Bacillus sp. ISL-41]
MNKGEFLFMAGLFTYMACIYLSIICFAAAAAIGVSGGLIMRISTYYLAMKN